MSADRYQQYFPKIEANRRKLESFISEIKKTESGPPDQAWRRILFAHLALDFASSHSTGLYTSEIIEKVFLDMAGKHRIFDVYPPVEKKHVLHVVTRTYLTGGHTRVLERWVAQAEADEKHSLVFLSQEDKDQIPPKLQDYVLEKGGDFLLYDHSESMLERALKLRRLAQAREYVVLHVHPSDPIPLLAFGSEEFTRPVVFFNHSDHSFWCGAAICDLVLDLSRAGQERSLAMRGVARSEILGIPLDSGLPGKLLDRDQAKAGLNWPLDQKMILVSGSSPKFRHIGNDGQAALLLRIIQNGERRGVMAIGPDPREPAWAGVLTESGGRMRLSPPLPYDKGYLDCLSAADLALDSYPVPGGTAAIDAILAGKPFLSLKSAYPQSDFITDSESCCRSEEELLAKADRILLDEAYARKISAGTLASLEKRHSMRNWTIRRKEALTHLPLKHRIHNCFSREQQARPNDFDVLAGAWMEPDFFYESPFRAFRHLLYQKYKAGDHRYLKILNRYWFKLPRVTGGEN